MKTQISTHPDFMVNVSAGDTVNLEKTEIKSVVCEDGVIEYCNRVVKDVELTSKYCSKKALSSSSIKDQGMTL